MVKVEIKVTNDVLYLSFPDGSFYKQHWEIVGAKAEMKVLFHFDRIGLITGLKYI